MEKEFEEFWSIKPKRKGSNPKDLARTKFLRVVASGIEPQKIIGAARAWAKQERDDGKDGTEFVAMASTWLNQKRFHDFDATAVTTAQVRNEEIANAKGWFWNGERWENKGVSNVAQDVDANGSSSRGSLSTA